MIIYNLSAAFGNEIAIMIYNDISSSLDNGRQQAKKTRQKWMLCTRAGKTSLAIGKE